MSKIKIDKLILVEGKYDKIRLENIVDADIYVVNGFRIFGNKKEIETIKRLALGREILIMTDSDTAGYKIRVYLSKVLCNSKVTQVFIPQLIGKEKRKDKYSAEGFLGVEGISDEVLYSALLPYTTSRNSRAEINSLMLYNFGFMGKADSKQKKNMLLKKLNIQTNISNNFLIRILNERFTETEFKQFVKDLYLEEKNGY